MRELSVSFSLSDTYNCKFFLPNLRDCHSPYDKNDHNRPVVCLSGFLGRPNAKVGRGNGIPDSLKIRFLMLGPKFKITSMILVGHEVVSFEKVVVTRIGAFPSNSCPSQIHNTSFCRVDEDNESRVSMHHPLFP